MRSWSGSSSWPGFGSRHAGEAVALGPDGSVVAGRILGGLADAALGDHARAGHEGVVEIDVSDPDAAAAGMACGGRARLLVQPVDSIAITGWRALGGRRPVVLATDLETGGHTSRHRRRRTFGSVGRRRRQVDEVAVRLLRGGRSTLESVDGLLVEAYLPPTTVRIVGHAGVGEALAAQAELLGWDHDTVDGTDDAVAAAEAQASHDALVVLSHDEAVDTPALGRSTHPRTWLRRRARVTEHPGGSARAPRSRGLHGSTTGTRSTVRSASTSAAAPRPRPRWRSWPRSSPTGPGGPPRR